MEIPESMQAELAAWNNGQGIDLESWIVCSGNFSLAAGYATMFWPQFEEYGEYIFYNGVNGESVRGFEAREGSTKKSIEWVMNHVHIADLHYRGCEDISKDKLIFPGSLLKEIYEAKLKWQFPDKPCIVEFCIPEDEDDLDQYQLSFWQEKHEDNCA